MTSRKTFCIVGISILHITASGFDQFVSNVFKGEGYPHQVSFKLVYQLLNPNKNINFLGRSGFGIHGSRCTPFYSTIVVTS